METVLVKCRQGEKVCVGLQEYITIDQVDLLFVDSNLDSQKVSVDYPRLKNFSTTTTSKNGMESRDEVDCGRIPPLFTNIEIERANKKLEHMLGGVKNILTHDKTSHQFLRHFTNRDASLIPIGHLTK